MLNYLTFIAAFAGFYALLSLSLVLVWGRTGMVNLGVVGFYALGAYTSALLVTRLDLPIAIGWVCATLVAAACGAGLTWVTRRLRGDYLGIVTLGFAELVRSVATNETWLTKGSDGISGIPGPFKAAMGTQFNLFFSVLTWIVVAVVCLLAVRLLDAPYGRVLMAIRDDAEVTGMAGKNVVRFKIGIFAIGSAVVGLAGAMYAHFTSYIVPDIFSLMLTMYVFLAATGGGSTRVAGAVIGGIATLVFLEGSRFLAEYIPGISPLQAAAVREMLTGCALVCLLILRPGGWLREKVPSSGRP